VPHTRPPPPFSEKSFYLQEFRGRTLALCAADAATARSPALRGVIRELAEGGARLLLLAPEVRSIEMVRVPAGAPRLEGDVWRALQKGRAVHVEVDPGQDRADSWRSVAGRLGVSKLVWIDADGGLVEPDGQRDSFVDLEELRGWVAAGGHPRAALLAEVESLLGAGVAAVNVCAVPGLAEELFTYAGSGTLFTRERYLVVRRLTLDDYDAASDLMARGVDEGYLTPRSEPESDRILAGGFGAFVGGSHLAGIGALLVYEQEAAGEIAALYTLTRFQGEGVGSHLVAHALEVAAERGLERVFGCTTQARVGEFFERQGFSLADADSLPPRRWVGYDAGRRRRLRCYQLALKPS
jgi:amino-acid N-acetyltransferase